MKANAPAVLLALSLAVPGVTVVDARCAVGGGRNVSTDCYVEFEADICPGPASPRGPGVIGCTDGDSSCDGDGQMNGVCTFSISVCEFQPDVPSCAPRPLTKLKGTKGVNLPPTGVSAPTCGSPSTIAVRVAGQRKRAHKRLRVLAEAGDKTKDVKVVSLVCRAGSTTTMPAPGRTTTTMPPEATAHYEYVFPDGSFHVYDMDDGHRLVKSIALPQTRGIRGVVANAPTHSLYVSYGGDGDGRNGTPSLLKYDVLTDTVEWTHSYAIGIDSMSVSPDGGRLYMPSGEVASGGVWYVIDASNGAIVGSIDGPPGPHNTIVGGDGGHVYLGGRADNHLAIADTGTNRVLRRIGPLQSSVRPFTINGGETIAYVTVTGLRGFQIGDIASGEVLRTVTFTGPNVSQTNGPSAPSHGISLSPDGRELYVVDWPDYVHVFDVSGVPAQAPRQVADLALNPSMNHVESPCLYDCLADGWLQHSRDGRFVYVGDQGDVIDTATRRPVTNLRTLYNTRKMIEIDWRRGLPVFAANARASVGYAR